MWLQDNLLAVGIFTLSTALVQVKLIPPTHAAGSRLDPPGSYLNVPMKASNKPENSG